jgi:hypothetical protein
MLIVLGAVLVLLGAWHLLAPRTSFLVRRGERPGRYLSRARLASARTRGAAVAVLGLVLLVLSPGPATDPAPERAGPNEAAQAWGLETSTGPGRVRIIDVPVASTGEAPELAPPEAPAGYTRALRWAVVGSVEHGPRIELPGVEDGDLLVLLATGRCQVAHVLADMDEESVRLAVVVEPPLFGRPPPYPTGSPALDWPLTGEVSPADLGSEGLAEPRCDDRTSGTSALAPVQLVRVPLDGPLGDRRVVDGPTGTLVPPVEPPAG